MVWISISHLHQSYFKSTPCISIPLSSSRGKARCTAAAVEHKLWIGAYCYSKLYLVYALLIISPRINPTYLLNESERIEVAISLVARQFNREMTRNARATVQKGTK